MNVLITGAAGLVGSQMIEVLLHEGAHVTGVDNFTLGTRKHLSDFQNHPQFTFQEMDVSKPRWFEGLKQKKFDALIHLAANSDISLGHKNPEIDSTRTFSTTFEALQATRELHIPYFLFSSTSAVYGETEVFPTPEDLPSPTPVSIYGAGKLASEAFISAFSHNYGFYALVFRFGNVVGKKLTHGVIYDFVEKIRKDPSTLTVLGNGKQNKTYIHVEDCVQGMLYVFKKTKSAKEKFQVFNLSTDGATTVRDIAEESVRVLTEGKTSIVYGSAPIGWVGDVPKTSLDVKKITALGWKPKYTSTEAVKHSIQAYSEWSK